MWHKRDQTNRQRFTKQQNVLNTASLCLDEFQFPCSTKKKLHNKNYICVNSERSLNTSWHTWSHVFEWTSPVPCYETFSSTSARMCFNASFDFLNIFLLWQKYQILRRWLKCEQDVKLFLKPQWRMALHVRIVLCFLWRVRSRRWTGAAWRRLASAFSPLPVSCVPLFPLESQPQTCCPQTEPASVNIHKSPWNPM